MPDFWGSVGDGNQRPGQWGASPTQEINGTSPGSSFWSNYFSQGANAGAGPQVGFNTANADQARGWQQQIMQDLQRQAAGDPNSRAQQSLTQGYGAARAGQSAIGSSARGTGGAAGLRAGAMGAANVQRGYAGDSQMLMQQEQLSAQSMLAQQLAQMRGLDAGQAAAMAANAQGNQGLNNAMAQFYTSGGIRTDTAAHQVAAERARAGMGFDLEGKNIESDLANRAMQAGATGVGVAGRYAAGGAKSGTGYRQVDGQDSIVPDWDK